MKAKVFIVLRWIFLFPIALACLVLSIFLFGFMQILVSSRYDPEFYFVYVNPVVSAGFGGVCYMFVGMYIAPTKSINTAIALLVTICVISGANLALGLLSRNYINAFSMLAVIIAATSTFLHFKKQEIIT